MIESPDRATGLSFHRNKMLKCVLSVLRLTKKRVMSTNWSLYSPYNNTENLHFDKHADVTISTMLYLMAFVMGTNREWIHKYEY